MSSLLRLKLDRRFGLVAAAALLPLAVASAQERPRTYLEIGLDPVAVVTRPLGSLTSVRGTTPCAETYDGTTRVNLGVLAWLGYVLDGSDHAFGAFALRSIRLSAGVDDISSR
jgi:hypothetical protein